MALIYIFFSLAFISGGMMFFITRSHRAYVRENELAESFVVVPIRHDLYKFLRGLVLKIWNSNSHKLEGLFVQFAHLGGRFEKVILKFVDFVWGKHKIENNGKSEYWGEMIEHKNGLSGNETDKEN